MLVALLKSVSRQRQNIKLKAMQKPFNRVVALTTANQHTVVLITIRSNREGALKRKVIYAEEIYRGVSKC